MRARGQTAIEYLLLILFLVFLVIVTLALVRGPLVGQFGTNQLATSAGSAFNLIEGIGAGPSCTLSPVTPQLSEFGGGVTILVFYTRLTPANGNVSIACGNGTSLNATGCADAANGASSCSATCTYPQNNASSPAVYTLAASIGTTPCRSSQVTLLPSGSATPTPTPTPTPDPSPSVTLNSPANGASIPPGTAFSYTPADNAGFSGATLYGNFTGVFTANGTNASTITNNSPNVIDNTVYPGYYVWNVRACDNAGNCSFAPANHTLTVNASIICSPIGPAPSGGQSWPMMKAALHGPGQTSAYAPGSGTVAWNFNPSGTSPSRINPSVVNGRVFGASIEGVAGRLFAVNETTGAQLWNAPVASSWQDAGVAVGNGRVFTGTVNDRIYAFNESTGAQLWNTTDGEGYLDVRASPRYAYGRLYVPINVVPSTGDGSLRAYNVTNGNLLWSFNTSGAVASAPAISNGRLFFAENAAPAMLWAINPVTGALIWNQTLDLSAGSSSSPAVVGGRVYVGGTSGMYAFNEVTGALVWNHTGGLTWRYHALSSPAVADGRVYVGHLVGIKAYDADTGAVLWNQTIGGRTDTHPSVTNGVVYAVAVGTTKLLAYDASTGTNIWNYTPLAVANQYSSVAIANGRLYLSGGNESDSELIALGPAAPNSTCAGAPIVSLDEPAYGTNVTSGTNTFSYVPYDDSGFSSATLYANFSGTFSAITANTSSVTNGATNYFSAIVPAGFFVWNVHACDDLGSCAFAPANFTLNSTPSP